jgi:hypothetical protein
VIIALIIKHCVAPRCSAASVRPCEPRRAVLQAAATLTSVPQPPLLEARVSSGSRLASTSAVLTIQPQHEGREETSVTLQLVTNIVWQSGSSSCTSALGFRDLGDAAVGNQPHLAARQLFVYLGTGLSPTSVTLQLMINLSRAVRQLFTVCVSTEPLRRPR